MIHETFLLVDSLVLEQIASRVSVSIDGQVVTKVYMAGYVSLRLESL